MKSDKKKIENRTLPFKKWVSEQSKSSSKFLPLTHITLARFARDILSDGRIEPRSCKVLGRAVAYFFYGRAAYRVGGDETVSTESRLPICFILKSDLIRQSNDVYPFDSGAFEGSLYKDYMGHEFQLSDFSLAGEPLLPNQLISTAYPSLEDYVSGNSENIVDPDEVSNRGDFEVQAYLKLINSEGSNTPDDRVGSIEVLFSDAVEIKDNLVCAIVPHTLMAPKLGAQWPKEQEDKGVKILTYEFLPKRRPEYFQAEIEKLFRDFCKERGLFEEGGEE